MLSRRLLFHCVVRLYLLWCLIVFTEGRQATKESYSYQFLKRSFDRDDVSVLHDSRNHDEGNKWLCAVFGICMSVSQSGVDGHLPKGLSHVFEWNLLEFDYPSVAARQSAIASGEFAPTHPAPIDVDVYFGTDYEKVFVTIPRFLDGIPVTLGYATSRMFNGNPVIAPYPSWRWHQNPTACPRDRIVSVFRIKIDECGRLWVLDAGRVGNTRICPAQILAFDLATDELLVRYEIPDSQLQSSSILVTPIVDVRDSKCRDTFVYAADCQAFGLIVFDVKRETSWKVVDKTMYPYPSFGTFHILGQHFELMDGILGMDLSPYKPGEDRVLFYHAMSSGKENWVYTSHIRNRTTFLHDPSAAPDIFHTYPGGRRSQVPGIAIDKKGIAYFGLASDTSINCWNTETDYDERNFGTLAQDQKTLQFPSGIKVINNPRGYQELWFVTNRFQRIATGTLEPREINFRIQRVKIDELLLGSKCHNSYPGQQQHGISPGGYGHKPAPSYGGSYGFPKNNIPDRKHSESALYFPPE